MRRILASSVLAVGLAVGGFNVTSADAGTARRQLNLTIPDLPFNGVGLTEAIDFVRDVSGANINVNWKALEEAGVSKDAPVNVRLHNVSVKKALETILTEVGGGDKLSYDIDQNVITVTTKELADARMFTRVYPIQDLIMEIPDFTDAPDFSLNTTSNNSQQNPQGGGGIGAGGGGGGGGGGAGLFNEGTKGSGAAVKTKEERAADLMALIMAVVQPDAWVDSGGKSAMRVWNGNLIVTAPRSIQEAIGGAWD